MPWLIGIDEAGYGPNLGPMVQSSVAIFLPDSGLELWEVLAPAVRRAEENDEDRLLIDYSKKVNDGTNGFRRLERGVLAARAQDVVLPFSLADLLNGYWHDGCRCELLREPWFDLTSVLPFDAPLESVLSAGSALHTSLK